jgi:hypothetical protein
MLRLALNRLVKLHTNTSVLLEMHRCSCHKCDPVNIYEQGIFKQRLGEKEELSCR